jgi:hypothetical protein
VLDRVVVAQKLARLKFAWNSDVSKELSRAAALRLKDLFKKIVFGAQLTDSLVPLLPAFEVASFQHSYCVLAVDGSQIYPDRSFADGQLALLNVGGILLDYGARVSAADFFSEPEWLTLEGCAKDVGAFPFCPELIDLLRSIRELELGLQRAVSLIQQGKNLDLVLFDGSMLQHGLMLKSLTLQKYVFEKLGRVLALFREHQILVAWYTSAPHAHGLAALVCDENVTDAQLLVQILGEWQTSPLFSVGQQLSMRGAVHPLDACVFLYFFTGQEVARLEFPRWIANKPELYGRVCALMRDQVEKGMGYPVALTEAHRQAVVSEADRQSILQLLEHSSFHGVRTAKMLRKIIVPV